MNKWIAGAVIGVIAASFTLEAEAQRRLGGARNLGKQSPQVQQRQATPPAQTPQQQAAPAQPGAQQAAPTKAPAAAGAAAPAARAASPMRGALMGLAAGLGIAALASWLGFGEALTMFLTVLLLGFAVMLLVGFVMRRMRGPQPAAATGAAGRGPGTYSNIGYETAPAPQPVAARVSHGTARPGSAMDQFMRGAAPVAAADWSIPAGFDTAGFLRQAKENFTRLQHAWDRGNLDEIAEFTTDDLFIALTHELRARGGTATTSVVTLDAELLGIESTADEHTASVKFDGTVRIDGEDEQVSEVWNLVKPARGPGGWLLAGIQQTA
jgi:predicted lipid-binding transport protein (Tim44 family)